MRQAEIERQTKETYVYVSLNIDGKGEADVDTGVGFMDHMLELLAFHGNFDLKVRCKGDLQVDSHHTVEDLGIVLGQCFNKALGDKRGITRYGHFTIPMDEALVTTDLDFSGRPYLVFNVELDNIHLGNYEVEMTEEFFRAFAYNCFMTFIWSRAASFIYCGLRNGYGYRDTVQDIQGIIHLAPEMAADKIRFMLSAQVANGGGLPLVKFTHNAGHEDTPDDASYVKETGHPAYRADDALWLFPTIYKYVTETGNLAFMDEVIPYANKDEGTVYDHLKRAIDFSMNHLGNNRMPAGLHADWNDCLRLGKQGESTFVAMQLYYAMSVLRIFAEQKNDTEYIAYLDKIQKELGDIIQTKCWEDDRYIRGYKEDGMIIGSKHDPEANMWLNPQSWAVISGLATKDQAEKALESVHRELNTPYGVRLMAPSYVDHAFEGAFMLLLNPSTKENGGIFSQPQGWIILAESLMGHGNRAFEYFTESSPASMNDKAEIRKLEPYCHGQFTESSDSPFEGRAHVHWLTGTASTVMVGCVEGILGMRPDFDGLRIAPSVPSDWKEFEINKDFRGKKLHIVVKNPNGAESGYKSLVVNGKEMSDNYIAASELADINEIILTM